MNSHRRRIPRRVMALRNLLHEFAGGTTMHGMPKAIRAHSTAARIFWSVVCILAASMFCVQFAQLLQKYFSYPKKVTIEIVPAPVPFPAISLCNMRNLDVVVLNTLNKIFLNSTTAPLTWDNNTGYPFINAYMRTVSKYYPMFQRLDLDMNIFQTVLTRTLIASNIDRKLVATAGVPFAEFIVTCQYGGNDCNRSQDFTQFFDSYYYNCFTYRAPDQLGADSTLAEGLENGWSTVVLTGSGMLDKNQDLRTIPGTHERFSPISSNDGVRVVIHPPDTEPYPHTEGFDVPPGYSVTFGVKARLNHRIRPPHGNCSDKDPFNALHGYQYRLIACQKTCLQHQIIRECGCKDISLPGGDQFPNLRYCTNDDEIEYDCRFNATDECIAGLYRVYERHKCVRNASARVTRNASLARSCGCYPPCEEVSYDVAYSLSKWPGESFDGEEAYIDIFHTDVYIPRLISEFDENRTALYAKYFDIRNRRTAMKDFARLNVYIADSNVLATEEAEDYTSSQLLSDIGGQLGLWVGISVITLAEVLELMMDLFQLICYRRRQRSRNRGLINGTQRRDSAGKQTCQACQQYGHINGTIPMACVENEDPSNLVWIQHIPLIMHTIMMRCVLFYRPNWMHLLYIPQCPIQNINVHISALNGALWDMEWVHYGICELGQLWSHHQFF